MTKTIISSTVTHTVTLGSSAYAALLTISNTGAVLPSAFGAIGVYGSVAGEGLVNFGAISGAAGSPGANGGVGGHGGKGGAGGAGADLTADGTITSTGTVLGGAGGIGGFGGFRAGAGGVGGSGVELTAGKMTNDSIISGGRGGNGGFQSIRILVPPGGNGGSGVDLVVGATITNTGAISGGNGGNGGVYHGHFGGLAGVGGSGGNGVDLNGGTLINAGTVSGGAGGPGRLNGAAGDAVKFGKAAATLVIDPGAVFNGLVVGNGSNDTLVLASAASGGTLSGLGSQFTGFTNITETAGAKWTLTGANSLGAGTTLTDAGVLAVAGTLSDAGAATVSGRLRVGGSVSIGGSVTGTGSVAISSHAVLSVGGAFATKRLSFLAGGHETAMFGAPTAVSATIAGFAGTNTIDLLGFVSTTDTFAGHTLTIASTGGSVAHLHFAGSYSTAAFTVANDGHGNTMVTLR